MEFLIDGKIYNDGLSTKLSELVFDLQFKETLYRTETGAFFVVRVESMPFASRTSEALTDEEGRAMFAEHAGKGGALVPVADVLPDAAKA